MVDDVFRAASVLAPGCGVKLRVVPVTLREANDFVARHHRHHKPVRGHKFSLAAASDAIVGVVIVGRPVARHRDDGKTLEVTRLCTDGTKNACSFLYAAAARVVFAMGYNSLGTYILDTESGVSLRAAGWEKRYTTKGGSWCRASRVRADAHSTQPKIFYEKR